MEKKLFRNHLCYYEMTFDPESSDPKSVVWNEIKSMFVLDVKFVFLKTGV